MARQRKLIGVGFVALALALAGIGHGTESTRPAEVPGLTTGNPLSADASEAYIYGYSLLMLGMTERVATTVDGTAPGDTRAPLNQFVKGTTLPNGSYKDVVLPSTSTLYAAAFLNLADQPVVMHIPPIDRFFIFEVLDAWTNVSKQSPGSRLSSPPGDYAFVGPNWNGQLPDGLTTIPMPTNTVWIIGRIFTSGTKSDLNHITNDIFPALTLTPLAEFGAEPPYEPPTGLPIDPSIDTKTTPLRQVANMDACAFFGMMAALLQTNPPLAQDDRMVQRLANIGIRPSQPFDCGKLGQRERTALQAGVLAARNYLQNSNNNTVRMVDTHWAMPLNVGDYGRRYLLRAFVAQKALGANLPEDAVYAYSTLDGSGAALKGSGQYAIHFAAPTPRKDAGEVPPVNPQAFWSVTIYNNDGTLVDKPGVTYNAIGVGPTALGPTIQGHTACINADGSLDLYLQADRPTDSNKICNWLPIPATPADPSVTGDFIVFLRMYWPDQSVLQRRWIPPAITPGN